MTIICAYHDGDTGEVWIGADSRVTGESFRFPITATKWRIAKTGRHAIGMSGASRAAQLIRGLDEYALFKDATPRGIGDLIRSALRDDGFLNQERESGPPRYECQCILVVDGRVYDFDTSGSVALIDEGQLWARGRGMDYALGAAHAMRRVARFLAPIDVVKEAIAAACAYDLSCGGEPFIARTTTDGWQEVHDDLDGLRSRGEERTIAWHAVP